MSAKSLYTIKPLIKSLDEKGGLETVFKMIRGELYIGGLCDTMKIDFKDVSAGWMFIESTYDSGLHGNAFKIAHGAWQATMIDTAAGFAALSLVPKGHGALTKAIKDIEYKKPVISGLFKAVGHAVWDKSKPGHISAHAQILDENDVCYAEGNIVVRVKRLEELIAKNDL